MTQRVYIDASILILASRATDQDQYAELTLRALEELNREDADFLYSSIVKLEVLPQPTIHGYKNQVGFLEEFFASSVEVPCDKETQNLAIREACSGVGLDAADALHVACAVAGNADELVCAETKRKTLPQCKALPVRTIRDD